MKELLFSYGTLQQEKIQENLYGRKLTGEPDALAGYTEKSITITDRNFLSKGEAPVQRTIFATGNILDRIEGTAFEITTAELLNTDNYEPCNYRRTKIKLVSGREAWVYIAVTQ